MGVTEEGENSMENYKISVLEADFRALNLNVK